MILRIGIGVAAYMAAFTVIASLVFLQGTGLVQVFSFPLWQWWEYALTYPDNPVVRSWLIVSGLPAAILPLFIAGAIAYQQRYVQAWSLRRDWPPTRTPVPPIRSTTDNYGHARWASVSEMQRLWPGPDPAYGGIVIGEAYDPRLDKGQFSPHNPATWGHGGKAPLLIDPCREGSTHSLIIAGSGAFKTVSAVSTILTWRGSTVVLDPAGELGPMLEADRRRLGHRVFILSPGQATANGFNVLDWIDIHSPTAETDVRAVVEWICGYTQHRHATAEFFKNRGKALVTCLLAHMMWDPDLAPELKTLRTLRAAMSVSEAEIRKVLKRIYKASLSRLARDLAGPLSELVNETFSGIYANADEDSAWLSTTAYADLVSGTAFKTRDITDGGTDVFVSLPLKAMQASPAVARCIIGALLNAVYEADGNVRGRILFLLDEARLLGHMQVLEVGRDIGRKYGVTMQLLYQSVGALEAQWGREGKRAWEEGVSWRAYAAVKDVATAEELSNAIGSYGVLSWSQSSGTFGKTFDARSRSTGITYSERARSLIRPEEIMHDLREDAQIIIPKNGRPALCGRAVYFRRPELATRIAANRFAQRSKANG